jgi:hypothetical protein
MIGTIARVRAVRASTNSIFGELESPVHSRAVAPVLQAAAGGA